MSGDLCRAAGRRVPRDARALAFGVNGESVRATESTASRRRERWHVGHGRQQSSTAFVCLALVGLHGATALSEAESPLELQALLRVAQLPVRLSARGVQRPVRRIPRRSLELPVAISETTLRSAHSESDLTRRSEVAEEGPHE